MQVGQFITGMINGTIERRQTANVDRLLSEDSLKFLYHLGRANAHVHASTYIYTWDREAAITRTTITPAADGDRRMDLVNHTLIVKFDNVLADVLTHTNILAVAQQLVEPLPP